MDREVGPGPGYAFWGQGFGIPPRGKHVAEGSRSPTYPNDFHPISGDGEANIHNMGPRKDQRDHQVAKTADHHLSIRRYPANHDGKMGLAC